jgi:HK97 family phage prohead protease
MLERMRCDLELKFVREGSDAKVGTFAGYGAVFNNLDGGGDVIAPGAFKKTLKAWKSKDKLPKMLLQHGSFLGPAEDGIPIGKYTTMEEDSKGLYLEGELFALDTQKGKYIYEGMSSGELDGLSIGYEVVDVSYGKKPDEPRRTLKALNLREVSVVTFPMNDKASVTAVKSIEEMTTLADAESYLRDAGGFSRQQALAFISRIKSLRPSDSELASLRPSDSELATIAEAAKAGARLLSQLSQTR